jgi:hypothetical protein
VVFKIYSILADIYRISDLIDLSDLAQQLHKWSLCSYKQDRMNLHSVMLGITT